MPYSIVQKIKCNSTKSETHIIQLDRIEVKVIGELKDVMIMISSNPKIHQVIDIVVVDIPKAYGMLLSRDWSHKSKGILLLIGLTYGFLGMGIPTR
jgi:tetrahydromethanopterin S-methyltransferase subunit F